MLDHILEWGLEILLFMIIFLLIGLFIGLNTKIGSSIIIFLFISGLFGNGQMEKVL